MEAALRTGRNRDDGFKVRGYHATARWQVDCDYANKLGPEERAYLSRFLREYYDGRRSGLQPLELQRDADRARRRNEVDILTGASLAGTAELDDRWMAGPEEDLVEALDERRHAAERKAHRRRAQTKERVRRYRQRMRLLSAT